MLRLKVFSSPNSSEAVLGLLKRFGSDLDRKHEVTFWLYFPTQELADRAAAEIRRTRIGVEVHPPLAPYKDWLCLASCPHIPDEHLLDALFQFLQRLADQYGGQFDGWESSLEGDDLTLPTRESS